MASPVEHLPNQSPAPQSRAVTRLNSGATPSVLAFTADAMTRTALTTVCEATGLVAAVHPGGVEACLQCIVDIPQGTSVIIDFDGCDIPEADAAVIATMAPAGVRLIATAGDSGLHGILAEAGILDFLPKPATVTTISGLFGGLVAKAPEPRMAEPRAAEAPVVEPPARAPRAPEYRAPESRPQQAVVPVQRQSVAPAPPLPAPPSSGPAPQAPPSHKSPAPQLGPAERVTHTYREAVPQPQEYRALEQRVQPARESNHQAPEARPAVSRGPAAHALNGVVPGDRLHQAITRMPQGMPAIDHDHGRVIAVIGVRGGVGASSLASSIACSCAKDFAQRTALIDLDFTAGTQLLAVNAQSGTGLRESLERPSRLDSHMVDRLAIKLTDDLHLFGAEENPDMPAHDDAASAAELIRHIAAQYRRVIVDVPRTMPALFAAAVAIADEIVLVGDLTLAGARDLLRTFAWLHRVRPNVPLRLVSGGANPPKRELVVGAEFRRLCGRPLDLAVPFDAIAAADASRSGRPLIAVNSKIAKAVRALVAQIEGHDPPRRSFAFWRSKHRRAP